MTTASARALLASVVDYAGLFPPAALPIEAAVGEYRRRRRSPAAWMLGRFVVPAVQLAELGAALGDGDDLPWGTSALLGSDLPADLARVQAFNSGQCGRALFVDTVELKATTPEAAKAALAAVPPSLVAYVELPVGSPSDLLALLHARGARAKVRTGGVVAAAIPSAAELAGFLAASAAALCPFKATAGLHHAVRGEHALTYEAQAPRALMHGFLNVFAAAVIARTGSGAGELEAVLEERDPRAFRLDDDGLGWRDRRVPTPQVARCRASFALSFGSCSFAEPVDELRGLGVLP